MFAEVLKRRALIVKFDYHDIAGLPNFADRGGRPAMAPGWPGEADPRAVGNPPRDRPTGNSAFGLDFAEARFTLITDVAALLYGKCSLSALAPGKALDSLAGT